MKVSISRIVARGHTETYVALCAVHAVPSCVCLLRGRCFVYPPPQVSLLYCGSLFRGFEFSTFLSPRVYPFLNINVSHFFFFFSYKRSIIFKTYKIPKQLRQKFYVQIALHSPFVFTRILYIYLYSSRIYYMHCVFHTLGRGYIMIFHWGGNFLCIPLIFPTLLHLPSATP